MRRAAAIVIVLGATSCRQVLGIDQGTVRGDAGRGSDAGDDALEDASIEADMMIDATQSGWTNLAVVPGFAANDSDPTLTSDMLELYFTRGAADVYFSTRPNVASAWSSPTGVMNLAMGGNNDQVPELTGDGLVLQFASDRGAGTQMDIYYIGRNSRASQWSMPAAITSVNDAIANELTGSANTSGTHLTLSSTRNGGTGVDLYEAFRPGALGTAYDAPVRIPLSTDADDGAPFLTNDGLTLYYASSVGNIDGSRDLYVATRASDTVPFTTSTRIDELSSSANDSDPWVSPDGREIYFSSTRDGVTRIWHASR